MLRSVYSERVISIICLLENWKYVRSDESFRGEPGSLVLSTQVPGQLLGAHQDLLHLEGLQAS